MTGSAGPGGSAGHAGDDVEAHWAALVTAAILGAERRDPPTPPAGPVADAVADALAPSPAARLLVDAAVCTVVRRAAFVPGPPATPLAPPPPDDRPLCPSESVDRWRDACAVWPVLEDEWVLTVLDGGWRLPPDVAVTLLDRHRGDPARRERVVAAAGPVAGWILDHVPSLRATAHRGHAADPAEARRLPVLPIPDDLADLLTADADAVIAAVLPAFHEGRIGAAARPVLENLVARCRRDVLGPLAGALDAVERSSPSAGVARVLADLARARDHLLAPLGD